jgi:hypothetical protein
MTYPQYPTTPGSNAYGKPASKGLAITAAVLGIIGGVVAIFGAITDFGSSSSYDALYADASVDLSQLKTITLVSGVESLVVAALLLAGSILLLQRKKIGQLLLVIGCVMVIVVNSALTFYVLSLVKDAITSTSSSATSGIYAASGTIGVIVGLIPPVLTLIFAVVSPTKRWLAEGQTAFPTGYSAPGYLPQPGQQYPPQQQFPGQQYPPQNPPQQW